MRILIVDQDRLVRRSLVASLLLLRHRGLALEAAEADSYDAAAAAIQTRMPDCVITEISLGARRDGILLIDHLLGYRFGEPPLIVVLTRQDLAMSDQARFFRDGVHFFVKTSTPEDGTCLIEAVHDVVVQRYALIRGRLDSGIRLVEKPAAVGRLRDALADERSRRIDAALAKTNGNITRAAMLVGESRRWVQRHCAKKRSR